MDAVDRLRHVGRDGAYCGTSYGELDWSEFDRDRRDLECANRDRAIEEGSDAVLHPSGRCGDDGPCPDCLDFIWDHQKLKGRIDVVWDNPKLKAEYTRREFAVADGRHRASLGLATPTLQQFIRHAERFGDGCVVETARDYLTPAELAVLEVEIAKLGRETGKPVSTRQRRTTVPLRDQVRALRERGMVPIAIADTLNISDRRCREILNGMGDRKNGARKPTVQAGKRAAKAVTR